MPLKPLAYREVKRKLEAAGFVEYTHKGSHVKCVKVSGDRTYTAIVPLHKEIVMGTLKSIIRQAGMDPDEFKAL